MAESFAYSTWNCLPLHEDCPCARRTAASPLRAALPLPFLIRSHHTSPSYSFPAPVSRSLLASSLSHFFLPLTPPEVPLCLSACLRVFPFPLFNNFRKTSGFYHYAPPYKVQASSSYCYFFLLNNATTMQILSWKSVDLSLFCKHRHCHCDTTHKQSLSCLYLLCLTLVSLIMHTNNRQSWLFVCLMMHTSNPYTNIEWVHSLMMMHTNNTTQDFCLQWSMHTNN